MDFVLIRVTGWRLVGVSLYNNGGAHAAVKIESCICQDDVMACKRVPHYWPVLNSIFQ